ncbi:hypothetical protein BU26DRAFT_111575 [Trematosphaeria pertusa]|uniref:Uncharacterized protein n=1 Tax=Trematosphaeria pertusa TaxID=390896 RepID=A0A6A6I0I2_9PLEO|nr:uncharacterized protein BU26DRAFT_111575 [Trematosphaeria pertusa]KAF2243955.1 hypothetical protein BU26DRAFT_111575 [Trematosphaeria pertusa]
MALAVHDPNDGKNGTHAQCDTCRIRTWSPFSLKGLVDAWARRSLDFCFPRNMRLVSDGGSDIYQLTNFWTLFVKTMFSHSTASAMANDSSSNYAVRQALFGSPHWDTTSDLCVVPRVDFIMVDIGSGTVAPRNRNKRQPNVLTSKRQNMAPSFGTSYPLQQRLV